MSQCRESAVLRRRDREGRARGDAGCPYHTPHLDTALHGPPPSHSITVHKQPTPTAWHQESVHQHTATGLKSMGNPCTRHSKWTLKYQCPPKGPQEQPSLQPAPEVFPK